jgi:tagatose-6-phosphate ketose/aldose isomerase
LGKLASYAEREDRACRLILPERTNDRGFAMTSSYSSMLVAGAAVFAPNSEQLDTAARMAQQLLDGRVADISAEACADYDRLVVIGSGALEGTAREISLKSLELAGGKLAAISDTSLGFRHGPKIILSPSTVVMQLVSNDRYTRKYDLDLLEELQSDGVAGGIVVLSTQRLFADNEEQIDDIWLSLPYVVYGQIFAFLKSYWLGVSVDLPCPSGEVNRVVQGVTIYPFD